MPCFTSLDFDFPALVALGLLVALTAMRTWIWRQQRFPGKQAFSAAYFAMAWWLLAAGMELASTGPGCKLFWSRAAWPGIALLPTAWALFLYDFTNGDEHRDYDGRQRLRRLALLATGPALIGLLSLTDGWHHLFYTTQTRPIIVDGRMSLIYVHGPLFYVAVVYNYLCMMASLAIGLKAIWRSSPAFRGFFVVILGMTAAPIAGNLAYIIGGFTFFGVDPTPFLFSVVLGALGWLALNNRMMDINGIARYILFYDSRDPILITDPDAILVGYNPEAQRILGDALPKIGAPLSNMAELGPILARLRDTDRSDDIAPILCDDRAFDPRLRPIFNPLAATRASLGWLLTLVDITEQQHAATSLRLAAERAQEASQAKTQFVSTVSHELRTPLTSIQGALRLLDSPMFADLKPEAKRILRIAVNNADRLHGLIDDLLDLNRIEAGAMTFKREPVDLVGLLQEAAEATEGYSNSFSVSLQLSLLDTPLLVSGDYGRLMQVIANVLSNAFKFSRPGGTVTVTLERRDAMARISIIDDGIGIPEGAEDKVFGAFCQLDGSDTRKVSGSGLGLNIARRILEMHEGRIDYRSVADKGTTFFIDLPLPEDAPTAEQDPATVTHNSLAAKTA